MVCAGRPKYLYQLHGAFIPSSSIAALPRHRVNEACVTLQCHQDPSFHFWSSSSTAQRILTIPIRSFPPFCLVAVMYITQDRMGGPKPCTRHAPFDLKLGDSSLEYHFFCRWFDFSSAPSHALVMPGGQGGDRARSSASLQQLLLHFV